MSGLLPGCYALRHVAHASVVSLWAPLPPTQTQHGTKFKQIMEVMDLIALQLGGKEQTSKLYLWADYCCIDQVRHPRQCMTRLPVAPHG